MRGCEGAKGAGATVRGCEGAACEVPAVRGCTLALAHLRTVVDILQRNQDNLDQSLQVLAPFVRDFANTLGNGQWFDTVVYNLPPQNVQTQPCFISPKQDHKACKQ